MRQPIFLVLLFISVLGHSQEVDFKLLERQWNSILESDDLDEKMDRNDKFGRWIASYAMGTVNFNEKKIDPAANLNNLEGVSEFQSKNGKVRFISSFFPIGNSKYQYNFLVNHINSEGNRFYVQSICKNFIDAYCEAFSKKDSISNTHNWIGAYYFDMIETQGQFTNYYTLIGWNGEGKTTQKKVIDVFWFANDGSLRLGAPLFDDGVAKVNQVIYEYGAQNSMTLKYIPEQDWILMDHLSPPTSQYEGIYEYYGPDLSYDAYVWENGKWVLYPDVDADRGIDKRSMEFENPKRVLEEQKIYETTK